MMASVIAQRSANHVERALSDTDSAIVYAIVNMDIVQIGAAAVDGQCIREEITAVSAGQLAALLTVIQIERAAVYRECISDIRKRMPVQAKVQRCSGSDGGSGFHARQIHILKQIIVGCAAGWYRVIKTPRKVRASIAMDMYRSQMSNPCCIAVCRDGIISAVDGSIGIASRPVHEDIVCRRCHLERYRHPLGVYAATLHRSSVFRFYDHRNIHRLTLLNVDILVIAQAALVKDGRGRSIIIPAAGDLRCDIPCGIRYARQRLSLTLRSECAAANLHTEQGSKLGDCRLTCQCQAAAILDNLPSFKTRARGCGCITRCDNRAAIHRQYAVAGIAQATG